MANSILKETIMKSVNLFGTLHSEYKKYMKTKKCSFASWLKVKNQNLSDSIEENLALYAISKKKIDSNGNLTKNLLKFSLFKYLSEHKELDKIKESIVAKFTITENQLDKYEEAVNRSSYSPSKIKEINEMGQVVFIEE